MIESRIESGDAKHGVDGKRTSRVLMEIQVMESVLAHEFLEFINGLLINEWLDDGKLWINKYCITPLCKTYGALQ